MKLTYGVPTIHVEVKNHKEKSDPADRSVEKAEVEPTLGLRHSSVRYRTDLGNSRLAGAQETQLVIWDFLQDETVTLKSILTQGDTGKNLLKAFLDCVLRLDRTNNGLPLYSLGTTRLLQNVGIYILLLSRGHLKLLKVPVRWLR